MILNIVNILKDMPTKYVLIKLCDNFPKYIPNSDLDILCDDRLIFIEYLKSQLTDYKLNLNINKNRTHLDIMDGNKLHFKFDIRDNMSMFTKIKLDNSYITKVLNDRVKKDVIYVPNITDEILIRFLEYIEYKDKRPDKIKHMKHIYKLIESII